MRGSLRVVFLPEEVSPRDGCHLAAGVGGGNTDMWERGAD